MSRPLVMSPINHILARPDLSCTAKIVLNALCSHWAWFRDVCCPSDISIGQAIGRSVGTVQRALRELERAGDIHREKTNDGKNGRMIVLQFRRGEPPGGAKRSRCSGARSEQEDSPIGLNLSGGREKRNVTTARVLDPEEAAQAGAEGNGESTGHIVPPGTSESASDPLAAAHAPERAERLQNGAGEPTASIAPPEVPKPASEPLEARIMALPGRPNEKVEHGNLARSLAVANDDVKSTAHYRKCVNDVAGGEQPPERLRDAFRHAQTQKPVERGPAFGQRWKYWTAPKPPPPPQCPLLTAAARRARDAAEDATRPPVTPEELAQFHAWAACPDPTWQKLGRAALTQAAVEASLSAPPALPAATMPLAKPTSMPAPRPPSADPQPMVDHPPDPVPLASALKELMARRLP